MSRRHGGGFITSDSYWDIGTEDARGRDGDTSRIAATKFNDHRHSAYQALSVDALNNWRSELSVASTHPDTDIPGGHIPTEAVPLRSPGDVADLDGNLFFKTSTGVYCGTSGFGPEVVPGGVAPVPDQIAGTYSLVGASNTSFAQLTAGAWISFGGGVVLPSITAHRGQVTTRTVLTSALTATAPFPADLVYLNVLPTINVDIRASYVGFDSNEAVIPTGQGVPGAPARIEATTHGAAESALLRIGNSVVGYSVQTIDTVADNFFGRISISAQCTPRTFFTEAHLNAMTADYVAANPGETLDDYIAKVTAWADAELHLETLGAHAQVLCSFK